MLYRPSKLHNVTLRRLPLQYVLVLVALFFVAVKPPMPRALSSIAQTLAQPVWVIQSEIRAAWTEHVSERRTVSELKTYSTALEDELSRLRRENFVSRSHQNERVSAQAAEQQELYEQTQVSATVLLEMRGRGADVYFIDRGLDDGVRDRMVVSSPEGLALGYVERAHDTSSTVTLFSAANVVTNVMLQLDPPLHAVLSGEGAGTMRIELIRDIDVPITTLITLPTTNMSVVGSVVSTQASPEDAFQILYVRSPVSPYELRNVFVDRQMIWEPATIDVDVSELGADETI